MFDVAYNLSVQLATPSHCPLRRRRSSLTGPAHLSFSAHHPLRLGRTCDLCRMFWKLFVNFLAEANSHCRLLFDFVLQMTTHDYQSIRSLLHSIRERSGYFHFALTSAPFHPILSTPLFQFIRFSRISASQQLPV